VITLFKRFPKLRWRAGDPYPPISKKAQADYPALQDDFAILDQELLPIFIKFDQQALKNQNRYWLSQVVLIFGGALATILGALQAVLSNTPWPGIVEAVLAFTLTAVAGIGRDLHFQSSYFQSRVIAEVLRGEYFQFLGRLAPYDDDDEDARLQRLRDRVQEIKSEGKA
jgi:hypothetical protein